MMTLVTLTTTVIHSVLCGWSSKWISQWEH